MKIWFDICHTPHVPFFVPQIRELQKLGHQPFITVRDRYQVSELCDTFGLKYKKIGRDYGKSKLSKMAGLLRRTLQLVSFVKQENISIAVTKGSPYQVLSAYYLKIPSIWIMDYEHSNISIEKRFATKILSPQIIPLEVLKKRGIDLDRVIQYPGLKEDVYLGDFNPDGEILNKLNIKPENIIVTLRPPEMNAHYQNSNSIKIYSAIVPFLLKHSNVTTVVLPRSTEEKERIQNKYKSEKDRIVVPVGVVNGLDLIWHSDLVISGGGTMNREAAVMGIPVYSIFQGSIGAVDRYLEESGRLVLIDSISAISNIKVEKIKKRNMNHFRKNNLRSFFVSQILSTSINN